MYCDEFRARFGQHLIDPWGILLVDLEAERLLDLSLGSTTLF